MQRARNQHQNASIDSKSSEHVMLLLLLLGANFKRHGLRHGLSAIFGPDEYLHA